MKISLISRNKLSQISPTVAYVLP